MAIWQYGNTGNRCGGRSSVVELASCLATTGGGGLARPLFLVDLLFLSLCCRSRGDAAAGPSWPPRLHCSRPAATLSAGPGGGLATNPDVGAPTWPASLTHTASSSYCTALGPGAHHIDVEDRRVAVLADFDVPAPLVRAVLRVQQSRLHGS
jgi:hypothetical protein